jgi:flavin-dependent dehydrogenase
MTDFDCVIIGAGPAGASLAQTLARAGHSVVMIERRTGTRHDVVETLPPAAMGLARQLLDLSDGTTPSRGIISAWGADAPLIQDYFFTPEGCGLCVNRAVFDGDLRNRAQDVGAALWQGAKLHTVNRTVEKDGWLCEIEVDGELRTLNASYIVDATGRQAALGKIFGIQRDKSDPLFAYALEFSAQTAPQAVGFARVESCSYGWWYCNAIPDTDRFVAVVQVDIDAAEATQASHRDGFLNLLADTKLTLQFLNSVAASPIGRIRGAYAGHALNRSIGPKRFLAVGDALQAFDPLSSQGVWRAMASGVQAGQLLSYALANAKLNTDQHAFLDRYNQSQAEAWGQYSNSYSQLYTAEHRWSDHSFWSRRSGPEFNQSQTLRKVP